ncbi:hypothetical protein ACWA1F_04115 [Flavobacterium sp. 3-218]
MKGFLLINDEKIGESNFAVIDETMGVIGGNFIPYESYYKHQIEIQKCCNKHGIANRNNFNFKIILSDSTELYPVGGIGVTDLLEFDEIYVESAGNSEEIIQKIKKLSI